MTAPSVRTIPSSDAAFTRHVQDVVAQHSFHTPDELARHLQRLFPRVVVRERGLEGERPVWYVYRDGRWRADAGGPWWTDPRAPRTTTTLDGWIVDASPLARSLLGVRQDDSRPHHFTEFVAPGLLEEARALFAVVAAGHELDATVVLQPANSEPIACDLHVRREGDRLLAHMRLADDVDAATRRGPADIRLVTHPAGDAVFADYAAAALRRLVEPVPDALALQIRRVYPHATVRVTDDHWEVRRDSIADAAPEWWRDPALPRVRFDGEALILDANDAARDLFGMELAGRYWHELTMPNRSERVSTILDFVREKGAIESRFRMPAADGSLVEFDTRAEWDGQTFTSVLRRLDPSDAAGPAA